MLIFDKNGFIAGMQNIVPMEKTFNDKYYGFRESPYYQPGYLFRELVMFSTVYFVDVARICRRGRTRREFEREGTANRLTIQNGPDVRYLVDVPLTKKGANKGVCVKY